MSERKLQFAVVGATGAVGREMAQILADRRWIHGNLRLLASARSAGSFVDVSGEEIEVEELTHESFNGIDIALFAAGGSVSKEFAPSAVEAGAVVIDNSSFFRMDPQIPLVVPEVNGGYLRELLRERRSRGGMIIANPNCSTIQLVVVLNPILQRAGLRRVVVSTYQSVSGAGKKGMDELWDQTLALFNQGELKREKFPHTIAFNCIPQVDEFVDNGFTKEEMKVINESRKILSQPNLRITATAVRVPVFTSHSESVNLETERPLTPDQLREILRESPGVIVVDDPAKKHYPLALDAAGTDATFVGRIRADESIENGFAMWIVADNLRKGAALNAVQIADIVMQEHAVRQEHAP